jgi:hypothetical protein
MNEKSNIAFFEWDYKATNNKVVSAPTEITRRVITIGSPKGAMNDNQQESYVDQAGYKTMDYILWDPGL